MSTPTPHGVTFREAVRVWCRVALLSFGGPAGQIAVMHRILVEEKRWVSESRFLHALNFCMLLPGPEAQQLATYLGWLLHRTWGGLVAGLLFILPGFVSILALSVIYAAYQGLPLVEGVFMGLAPAVLAIVAHAVVRIGRRVLHNAWMVALAVSAFVAIFFFNLPFPLIVLTAGLVGYLGGRVLPATFNVIKPHGGSTHDHAIGDGTLHHTRPTRGRAALVLTLGLALWLVPVAAMAGVWGRSNVFVQQGVFFSQAAVVTFGGAYAVLAYVAQQAVDVYGWLMPGEMVDGLGMAETTPGPLIQVVQFVGFMGAYRAAQAGELGGLSPMIAAALASVWVTWVTFVPCFLWIFLGAPYVERLRGNATLNAALSAITAAVVGVILNLALWFTAHTLFARVEEREWFGIRLMLPEMATLHGPSMAIAAIAAFTTFRLHWGMIRTLGLCVALGVAVRLLMGSAVS